MKVKFHTSFDDSRRHSQKCQSLQNTIHSSRILSRHGVSRVTSGLGVTSLTCLGIGFIISLALQGSLLSLVVTQRGFSLALGVRQGDLLSSSLFDIAKDFLSWYRSALCSTGALDRMKAGRNVNIPSHLLYANDMLLFCRATCKNAETLKYAFDLYGRLSGQLVNLEKSIIYFGRHVSARFCESIRSS